MKIVVTEEIETVGWDTVMNEAPKAIADVLKAGTKSGHPVVAGRLVGQPLAWVVVEYSTGQPVVVERDIANPSSQP